MLLYNFSLQIKPRTVWKPIEMQNFHIQYANHFHEMTISITSTKLQAQILRMGVAFTYNFLVNITFSY